MFELCGIATKCAPVRFEVLSRNPQRSSGLSLARLENGTKRSPTSAPSRTTTTRCRLACLGIALHSQASRVVKRPGA